MALPVLLPPANLHKVIEGVYRSAFPEEANYGYLETLHLKTVMQASPFIMFILTF